MRCTDLICNLYLYTGWTKIRVPIRKESDSMAQKKLKWHNKFFSNKTLFSRKRTLKVNWARMHLNDIWRIKRTKNKFLFLKIYSFLLILNRRITSVCIVPRISAHSVYDFIFTFIIFLYLYIYIILAETRRGLGFFYLVDK